MPEPRPNDLRFDLSVPSAPWPEHGTPSTIGVELTVNVEDLRFDVDEWLCGMARAVIAQPSYWDMKANGVLWNGKPIKTDVVIDWAGHGREELTFAQFEARYGQSWTRRGRVVMRVRRFLARKAIEAARHA